MKINVARSSGFCSGVRRAVDMAFRTARKNPRVYMLGDLVHNEVVTKKIERSGIKKIGRLGRGKDKTLLIRAHGVSRKVIRQAEKNGYRIVDATCPMVKDIHKKARKAEKEKRAVLIIGDKEHDEVKGIVGQLDTKPVIIDDPGKLPLVSLKKIKKAAIVVQSTQDLDRVLKIADKLTRIIPDLRFNNTICNPTRIKQKETKELPVKNDLVLVIGSKTSANTRRLYEISKALNPRTYWINSAGDIKKKWFRGIRSVGVTAGASTPDSTIDEIVACLRKI